MANGEVISRRDGSLVVPDRPTIPFIEGDGTGPDIWRASVRVFDAAVERACGERRRIVWHEVLAGEESVQANGELATRRDARGVSPLPRGHQRTSDDAGRRRHSIAERRAASGAGSLRVPAAGRYFKGMETPVKRPDQVSMVIFGRTPKTSTRASSSRTAVSTSKHSRRSSARRFRSTTGRSGSRTRPASASSQSPARAANG